jgi:hypothetical protein
MKLCERGHFCQWSYWLRAGRRPSISSRDKVFSPPRNQYRFWCTSSLVSSTYWKCVRACVCVCVCVCVCLCQAGGVWSLSSHYRIEVLNSTPLNVFKWLAVQWQSSLWSDAVLDCVWRTRGCTVKVGPHVKMGHEVWRVLCLLPSESEALKSAVLFPQFRM